MPPGPVPKPPHPPIVVPDDTCSPKPADEYARHVKEAAHVIATAYPDWARSTGSGLQPMGQSGEWSHKRGPPYVKKVTMFKGAGVDQVGVGTLIRRVLGLKTVSNRKCDLRSCDHAMTGNSYINTFDGMPRISYWMCMYVSVAFCLLFPLSSLLASSPYPLLAPPRLYRD